MDFLGWLMLSGGIYATAGFVFAIAFASVGAGRMDPVARRAPLGFRLLIAPGAAALWPALLIRWARVRRGETS